ncbi:MAG: cytochrome c biogenesis protein CcsA [Pirellulaceae bacterium]
MTSKEPSTTPTATTEQLPEFQITLRTILSAVGSLRLTVFLLALALILVLIATLQQTRRDIYQVKQQHFRAPVVYIQFQEMLPPAWFPETQDVGGGFMMPSGVAVLIAMLLNLLCAHAARFRVYASGRRLMGGWIVLGLGVALTLLVIINGNVRGFQETPLISWQGQWIMLQVFLGAAALSGLACAFLLGSRVRRAFALSTGVILGGLLAWLLYQGQSAFIGDDAMRVVWRLAQGAIAAVVCYIGALMVFKRKAGIVLIHGGLLMLMVGELYTTYSAVEQRMFFFEGESSQHTYNIDELEMAVMTPAADGTEDVITIPVRQLATDGDLNIPELPFRIRTLAYFPNSKSFKKSPSNVVIPGETGLAQFFSSEQADPVPGTDMDEANWAAAYVQLLGWDEERNKEIDLGTYLLSQYLYRDTQYDLDTVTVDGRDYRIGLRFRHYYKPYSVELLTTTRTNYTGTDTPRTYSSTFRIVDPQNTVDELKTVSMNSPLRYNNETFYQAGHDTDKDTGRQYSVLQVVRNTGWMIPYVSCAMVGIGLIFHFLSIFVRFVERISVREDHQVRDLVSWGIAAGVLLLFAMWAWRAVPPPVEVNGFNLDQFGRVPVVYGGRVQPLDSLARSTMRQLRKYEIAVDHSGEKQPPIRWLADWIFDAPDADEYRIFRIDDPDVISGLQLIRRKGHLYSLAEINGARDDFRRYVTIARQVAKADKSKLTTFQKRILELDDHIDLINRLRFALSNPAAFDIDDPVRTLDTVLALQFNINLPLVLPPEMATIQQESGDTAESDVNKDWKVLAPELAPAWIQQLSEQYETANPMELALNLVDEATLNQLRKVILRRELAIEFLRVSGLDPADYEPEQLAQIVDRLLSRTDPGTRQFVEQTTRDSAARIEMEVQLRREALAEDVAGKLEQFVPVNDDAFDFASLPDPIALATLGNSWLAGNSSEFNTAVQQHLNGVADSAEVQEYEGKVRSEFVYNNLSPFYLATSLYIGSLILSFVSWLTIVGGRSTGVLARIARGSRRAAFWVMIAALVIHSVGLFMRIYISGRPPVTNLYGSAVFIGWIGVLFGIAIERIAGHGFGTVLSGIAGSITLLIAFALGSEGDTFSVLRAVLDTQFWLSTHVVSITFGYAATLVAGVLGMLYLAISLLIPKDLDRERKLIAKMVYGVTCFALIFSFVGTVLGGLWADDSWGRFWGWDPKENGALMIVLVNAILLHSRWAGIIRDRGVAVIAIIGSMVTLWSWFAVNEMGVGLHAYAVTEGRMGMLCKAWGIHLAVILAAWIPTRFWLGNRAASQKSAD